MKDQTAPAKRKSYDSNLTDAQWSVLEPLLPPPSRSGRPRRTDLREVVNAIIRALRAGCAWRMLPPRPAAAADRICLLPNVEVRRNAEARPRSGRREVSATECPRAPDSIPGSSSTASQLICNP